MSEDTKTSINTCYGLENIKIYIGAACSICIVGLHFNTGIKNSLIQYFKYEAIKQ